MPISVSSPPLSAPSQTEPTITAFNSPGPSTKPAAGTQKPGPAVTVTISAAATDHLKWAELAQRIGGNREAGQKADEAFDAAFRKAWADRDDALKREMDSRADRGKRMLAREKMLKSMDKQLLLLALLPLRSRMGALKLMVKQLAQMTREMQQDGRPKDANTAPELFDPFQAIGSATGLTGPEGSDGATPRPAGNEATSKGSAEGAIDDAVDGRADAEKETKAIGPEIAAVGRMVNSMEVAFGKLQDHDGWMEARRDEFDRSMAVGKAIALRYIQRLLDRIKALAGIHAPTPGGKASGPLPGSGEFSSADGGVTPA